MSQSLIENQKRSGAVVLPCRDLVLMRSEGSRSFSSVKTGRIAKKGLSSRTF